MKRIALVAALFTLFGVQSIAQVPATVHATWVPNPAADNVVQYLITVDTLPPVVALAAVCGPTICGPVALTVPTFGLHTAVMVAQNLKFSGDPTSLQSGPSTTVTFTLGAVPAVVASFRVTN